MKPINIICRYKYGKEEELVQYPNLPFSIECSRLEAPLDFTQSADNYKPLDIKYSRLVQKDYFPSIDTYLFVEE